MKRVFLVLLIFLVAGSVFAQDRLQLKSGQTVEGKVIVQDETSIQMDVAGIPLTYWMEDVEFLEMENGTRLTPSAQEEPAPEAPERPEAPKGLQVGWGTVEPEPVPAPASPLPAAQESVEAPAPEEPPDEPPVVPTEHETFGFEWSEESPEEGKQTVSARASVSREGRRPGLAGQMSLTDIGLPMGLPIAIVGAIFFFFLLIYAYFSYCLQLIAQKTDMANGWFAWVPVMNVILMCDIAGRPRWWALAILISFIPLIGGLASLVVFAILAWDMCVKRGKPGWIGIGMILPLINFAAWGYVAFSE